MELKIFNTKVNNAEKSFKEINRHLESCKTIYPTWVEKQDGKFKDFTQDVADERLNALKDAANVIDGYLDIVDLNRNTIKPSVYVSDDKIAKSYFEDYIRSAQWDAKGINPKSEKNQYGNDFIDIELSRTQRGIYAVDVYWIREPEKENDLPKRDLLTRIPMTESYLLFQFLMISMTHQYI